MGVSSKDTSIKNHICTPIVMKYIDTSIIQVKGAALRSVKTMIKNHIALKDVKKYIHEA